MNCRSMIATTIVSMFTSTLVAAPVGPVYPAPGGNTFVNTGGVSGADALATWDYSGFDTNEFVELYFGLDQTNYGPLAAGLDGSLHALSFLSASGTTATWGVSSPYTSPGGGGDPPSGNYPIELRMTITGLGANPWIDPTTVGLGAGLGAVADNSSGLDYTLNWEFVADMGAGFIPLNSVPQPSSPSNLTQSSFATGFYSVVPEPGTFVLLLISAVCLVGYQGRRWFRAS